MDRTIEENSGEESVPPTPLAETESSAVEEVIPNGCSPSPVPPSSDDGHCESNDDSDDDLITCYLQGDTQFPDDSGSNQKTPEPAVEDVCPTSDIPIDSGPSISEDGLEPPYSNALFTSSSPRSLRILEANLQRLHNIHEGIQKLREKNSQQVRQQDSRKSSLARLCISCPSLDNEELTDLQTVPLNNQGKRHSMFNVGQDSTEAINENVIMPEGKVFLGVTNSSVKIHVNDLTPASSQECLATRGSGLLVSGEMQDRCCGNGGSVEEQAGGGGSGSRQLLELDEDLPGLPRRRRSWSSADQDEEKFKIKKTLAKAQRSMSLSSLDSESEEAFFDARDSIGECTAMTVTGVEEPDGRLDKLRCLTATGNGFLANIATATIDCKSCQSLNECQIQEPNDELRNSTPDVCKCSTHENLNAARSTLQKSVSTPSIIAVKDALSAQGLQEAHVNQYVPINHDSDEDPSISKKKKRGGSIFSRKKRTKEKDKELKKSNHQFVTVCYGNSAVCHVCNKSMANKPALRCETCFVTVHEHSCKDQISDCSRFKYFTKGGSRILTPNAQVFPVQQRVLHQGPWPLVVVSESLAAATSASNKEKKSGGSLKLSQQNQQLSSSSLKMNNSSTSSSGRVYVPSGYSQWRRVATKLGVNKVINEEKENETGDDIGSNIMDLNSTSMESLDEGAVEINDMEDDPELLLLEEEPEGWSSTVEKKILKKMKDKDVKRQENIYEFIITEKHHCLTLKIMQKIFAQGMQRELHMTQDLIDRLFPQLEELLEIHLNFLRKLRERQRQDPVIEKIADIILQQFQGETANQMKTAYGEFCSNHQQAVSLFKDFLKSDRKFQNFIKKSNMNPLCKTRGIPECILLVTQRITKYPLLLDALIKATKDNKAEQSILVEANILVKEIITNVNSQVAEKEREQRLLEIYHKIDAKSATSFRGKKFKKSDLLSMNRKLCFDGPVSLNQARGKVLEVTAVVLSDVIFFLLENNQKYSFCTQDNKPGVISLQKLLIREKAGQDSKAIYLISSNPYNPEMYEILCQSQKHKKMWIEVIRAAVEKCHEEDEGVPSELEEERKIYEAKYAKLRELIESLHEKDRELAVLCEEKMRIQGEMMEIIGKEEGPEPFKYSHFLDEIQEGPETRDILLSALQEASRLTNSLYSGGTNLSRSVSSVGEHQSEAYVSPILPKRAETFGGFDNPNKDANSAPKAKNGSGIKKKLHLLKDQEGRAASLLNLAIKIDKDAGPLDGAEPHLDVKGKETRRASGPLPVREPLSPDSPEKVTNRRSTMVCNMPTEAESEDKTQLNPALSDTSIGPAGDTVGELLTFSPPLISHGKEQWAAAVQLSHYLNTLICLFSQHFTNVESLKAQLTLSREQISKLSKETGRESRDRGYRHNQQLEELRNLQEQVTQERATWQRERETEKANLEKQHEELQKLQEHLKQEEEDIRQQREQLYRYLEALQRHGITLSPNMTIVSTSTNQGTFLNEDSLQALSDSQTSPSSHQRSVSCDLHTQAKEISSGPHRGSSSAASSPTQTLEIGKKVGKGDFLSGGNNNNSSSSGLSSSSSIKNRQSPNILPGNVKRDSLLNLPLNLYSATNQQKAASQALPVRQQLPLKLASGEAASSHHSILPLKLSEAYGGNKSHLHHHQHHMHQHHLHHHPQSQQPVFQQLRNSGGMPPHVAGTGIPSRSVSRISSSSSTHSDSRHSRMKDPDSNQEIIYF